MSERAREQPQAARVSWLTMGPDPHLATCQRCGKHEPKPPLPTPLTAFVSYLRYVEERHRFCLKPGADPLTGKA